MAAAIYLLRAVSHGQSPAIILLLSPKSKVLNSGLLKIAVTFFSAAMKV
jgi:hypothetical protein